MGSKKLTTDEVEEEAVKTTEQSKGSAMRMNAVPAPQYHR